MHLKIHSHRVKRKAMSREKDASIFTTHKRSFGQGSIFTRLCLSIGGEGICMMSLPVWLPDPMFLLESVVLMGRVVVLRWMWSFGSVVLEGCGP